MSDFEQALRAAIEAEPAPPGGAAGPAKKNYTERLSRRFTEAVAAELRGLGLGGVQAPSAGHDKRFMGGYGSKGVDAWLSDERHGLLLSSGTKGILFDVRKNLKNRYRDVVVEALELHKRFPYAVCGHLLFLARGEVQRSSKRFGTVLGEVEALFDRVSGRRHPEDPPELYEAIGVALFDPGRPESLDLAPAALPEHLHAARFCSALVEAFWRRNPFY